MSDAAEVQQILASPADLVYCERAVLRIGNHKMMGMTIRFTPVLEDAPLYELRLVIDPAGALAANLCSQEQYDFLVGVEATTDETPDTESSPE